MRQGRTAAGLLLDNHARLCGICGHYGNLSKTHVPPRAAGNAKYVERANSMTGPNGVGPGRWESGGMWVRGLCQTCNSFAGSRYDLAYAEFAHRLENWFARGTRLEVPGAQAVTLAPGRVSRSMLSGMLGLSPHIRVLHPTLAAQLEAGGPVHLPGNLTLRLSAYLKNDAQLTGPVLSGMVDGSGRSVHTLAAVTFRPLSWALVTSDSNDELANRGWIDVTEWLRYEDDRESHDLRWLAPIGLPVIGSVLHAPSNDGIQLYSKEIAPIMFGRLPS